MKRIILIALTLILFFSGCERNVYFKKTTFKDQFEIMTPDYLKKSRKEVDSITISFFNDQKYIYLHVYSFQKDQLVSTYSHSLDKISETIVKGFVEERSDDIKIKDPGTHNFIKKEINGLNAKEIYLRGRVENERMDIRITVIESNDYYYLISIAFPLTMQGYFHEDFDVIVDSFKEI